MKKHLLSTLTAIIGCLVLISTVTSCNKDTVKDTLEDEQKVAQIASVLKSGTTISVAAVVLSDGGSVKYFRSAVVGLRAATNSEDLTPDAVLDTISDYVNVTDTVYAGVIEGGLGLALAAYRTFYNENVEKEIDEYLVTLLNAIADGIEAGIGGTPAVAGAKNPIEELTVEDLKL